MFQVSAISKAQIKYLWRQKKFEKKSHSAGKNQKGDPLHSSGFLGYVRKVKNQKGPFGDKKMFEKVAQCRKKIERGDLSFPSGFVGYA